MVFPQWCKLIDFENNVGEWKYFVFTVDYLYFGYLLDQMHTLVVLKKEFKGGEYSFMTSFEYVSAVGTKYEASTTRFAVYGKRSYFIVCLEFEMLKMFPF